MRGLPAPHRAGPQADPQSVDRAIPADQWYSPMCVGFAVAHRLISAGLKLGPRGR